MSINPPIVGSRKPHDPVTNPCARVYSSCPSPAVYEVLVVLADGQRYAPPERLCYVHATDAVAVVPAGASIRLVRLDRKERVS